MEKTKILMIAKRTEALVIGFIGVFFFSMGTSYFQERLIYRIPRILIPIYEWGGSSALAIGMLLLGIALIVWGFSSWISTKGKKSLYGILAILGLIAGVFFANYNFKSSKNVMQEIENRSQKQIEEISKTERPKFKKPDIDQYFDDFDALYGKLEKNAASADSVEKINEEYTSWMAKTAEMLNQLNADQKYEFSKYHAKLRIQWHDKMQSIRQGEGE
ncbi:MAG: DUF308 domain-containing protein [Candidatus Azobacteroides sp.]|nr:DUF308 domain-containing protein [Candidatus Azobacteroides sp.]